MGGPADVRLHSDAALRLFTEEEANALLPQLEEIFLLLDPKLARLRELKDLVEDSEAYYGEGLTSAPASESEREYPAAHVGLVEGTLNGHEGRSDRHPEEVLRPRNPDQHL